MADDNAASPSRNRLTKERPEVGLARDLVKTEYRLRDERRDNGRDPTDTAGLWNRLAAELRRLMDRLTGRSQSAATPAGGDYASVGGREADRSDPWPPVPAQRPAEKSSEMSSVQSAHPDVARLGERIGRLSTLQHEAFEDAVLHLVRTDANRKKAFEQSPESMPTVARYAANAYMRESLRETSQGVDPPQRERTPAQDTALRTTPVTATNAYTDSSTQTDANTSTNTVAPTLTATEAMEAARDRIMAADAQQFAALRERWERPASPERSDAAPAVAPVVEQGRSGFEGLRQNEMADGQAFQAAQQTQWERLGTTPTATPSAQDAFDGQAFRAAEQAQREQLGTTPTLTPRPTDAFDGQAFQAAQQTQWERLGTTPTATPSAQDAFDGQAFLAAERAAQQTGRAAHAGGPVDSAPTSAPPSPVAPLAPSATLPSLLSGDGHAALRSSLESLAPLRSPTAPGSSDSPTRSSSPAPVRAHTTTRTNSQPRGRK
ncbi:hypothetical protein [Streptomyces sp. AVP053U2]|uniref:hypothetical protein n=1 Tax=Streptomyces sp. AVP053U2 TaxID=1737066 RepID=UPI00083D6A5A|nr:hypothetical protein [Streptomyces sp. AVP053U2]ODA73288.1 hypothetical protein APS67_002551 [Streptomyces sp. AVP053U2]